MSQVFARIRQNLGFSLLVANAFLLLVAFLSYDPFGLIQTGYAGADLLVEGLSKEAQVTRIEIIDPQWKNGKVELSRAKRISDQKLDKKAGERFDWELKVTTEAGTNAYRADRERVRELFNALREAKRYYALKRSPEKDRELDMGKDEAGRYVCPQLTLRGESGKEKTICVGRATGGESYARVGEEEKVYLTQTNLRTVLGSGELAFFRDRRLIPGELKAEDVLALSVNFENPKRKLSLAPADGKKGGWTLHGMVSGKADGSAAESLLNDILNLKAVSYPETLPKDVDRKQSLELLIITKGRKEPFRLEVLGKKDYSTYYVKPEDGVLREVSSVFLADVFAPAEKLLARSRQAPSDLQLPE